VRLITLIQFMAIIAMLLPSRFPHLQSSRGVIMAAALGFLAGRMTAMTSPAVTPQALRHHF
jgi:hypothetical protein